MSESAAPRLPWEGRAARADKVILGAIAFSGLYYLVTLPLVPWLLVNHPVVLALIRGGATATVTLGALARTDEVSLIVAVLAAVPGTIAFDWAYWWAGRRWGERSLAMMLGESKKTAARLARLQRVSIRFGAAAVLLAYYLPVPTFLVYAAAGWAGMRLATFLVLDVAGALLWIGLMVGLGYGLGQSAVDVVDAISDYLLWITIALVVVIFVVQFLRTYRRLR